MSRRKKEKKYKSNFYKKRRMKDERFYKIRYIHFSPKPGELSCIREMKHKTLYYRKDKKDDVTCPECVKKMKDLFWYCETHGFLDDVDVTDDETCDYCKTPLFA